jgi:hypothetical protein
VNARYVPVTYTNTTAAERALRDNGLRVPVEGDHGFRWKMITQSGGT